MINARFWYRAWHEPTKKLFRVHCFTGEHIYENTLDGVGTPTNPANTDDCVLEQCTGLKDKNGKLIYEGDILQVRLADGIFYAVVKFGRGTWIGCFPKWAPTLCLLCNETTPEIVGNIHENPELLEEKK